MQKELNLHVGLKSTQREVGKDLIECAYNAYIERCHQSSNNTKMGGICVQTDHMTGGKQDVYVLSARDMALGHKLALMSHPECLEDLANGKPIPKVIFEMIVEPFLIMVNTQQCEDNYERKIVNVELYTSCGGEVSGLNEPIMTIESDEEISEGRVC